MKKLYRFFTEDENLQKFLDSQREYSDYARKIFIALLNGELVPLENKEVDQRIKFARAKKTEAEANIKNWEWEYIKQFNALPSPQAKRALTERAKPTEESYFDGTENFKVNHLVGKYYFECKTEGCTVVVTAIDSTVGLDEMKKHLKESHGLGLYKGEIPS